MSICREFIDARKQRDTLTEVNGLSAGQNYWTTLAKQLNLLDILLHILLSQHQTFLIVTQ